MEKILLINGISPYLYFLAVWLMRDNTEIQGLKALVVVFLIQLFMTLILSIISRDKAKLAKITMINKFVQIPYYILFFVFAVPMFRCSDPVISHGNTNTKAILCFW